jgi:hypothetical protein
MDVLKPYFVLACVAFMVGFLGYWMLGQALTGYAAPAGEVYQAPASAPLEAPDFNRGKRI